MFYVFCALCLTVVKSEYFRILAVEVDSNGIESGIPLVLFRTAGNYISLFTDSAGNAAFNEPGLMDGPLFFNVLADGYEIDPSPSVEIYELPYDSGVVLNVSKYGSAKVLMRRTQMAARLYRLTGSGLYRDSVLTNASGDIPDSIISSCREVIDDVGVLGQDTVMTGTYKGKVFWFFGDTTCQRSARQNNCEDYGMYTVGATSCVPQSNGKCKANEPPGLKYFSSQEGGFLHVKPMAPDIAPYEQNTWIAAVMVFTNSNGEEVMYSNYMKNPGDGENAGSIQSGMAKWNDALEVFEATSSWPLDIAFLNGVHTMQLLGEDVNADGYVYMSGGLRVLATEETVIEYTSYQQYNLDTHMWEYLYAGLGRLGEGNSTTAKHVGATTRKIKLHLTSLLPSSWSVASVEWSEYVGMYVVLGNGGMHGGIYLAVGPRVTGPWSKGVLVASHNTSGTSCYNQVLLPHLFRDNGRYIQFACTFTAMWSDTDNEFSDSSWSTCLFGMNDGANCANTVPRYEYNNLVYEVDVEAVLEAEKLVH